MADSDLVLVLGIVSAVFSFIMLVLIFVIYEYKIRVSHYKSLLVFIQRYGTVLWMRDVLEKFYLGVVTPEEAIDMIGAAYYHTFSYDGKRFGKKYRRGEEPELGHINQWLGSTTKHADNPAVGTELEYAPLTGRDPVDDRFDNAFDRDSE